jgi:hypothetical protein
MKPCFVLHSKASMGLRRIAALASGVVGFLATDGVYALTYSATLLHPPSGYSNSVTVGISGNSQVGYSDSSKTHAILWNSSAGSAIDLHPTGPISPINSGANGVSGDRQVGWGSGIGVELNRHALLWSGTAESVVDLHPFEFGDSEALGISGTSQVGWGRSSVTSPNHALLWHGSAESVVDLHPSEFLHSFGRGVSGSIQVGGGYSERLPAHPAIGLNIHALLWTGTAESVVDIHPAGFDYSEALAVSGNVQVGFGGTATPANSDHALLWRGTAESVVDLHPPGFQFTAAQGVSEFGQVGYGNGIVTDGRPHALLWRDTAESVVDLQTYLNDLPVTLVESYATGIEGNGSIVGYGRESNGMHYAILWTPVPEPSAWTLLSFGMMGVALRARPLVANGSRNYKNRTSTT